MKNNNKLLINRNLLKGKKRKFANKIISDCMDNYLKETLYDIQFLKKILKNEAV